MKRVSDLRALIDDFVADVSAIARNSARDMVARELAIVSAPRRSRSHPRPPSTSDRAASLARAVSYLLAKPGTGAAELRRALGVNAPEMRTIVGALVAQRLATFKGNTRARVYFATTATTKTRRRSGSR